MLNFYLMVSFSHEPKRISYHAPFPKFKSTVLSSNILFYPSKLYETVKQRKLYKRTKRDGQRAISFWYAEHHCLPRPKLNQCIEPIYGSLNIKSLLEPPMYRERHLILFMERINISHLDVEGFFCVENSQLVRMFLSIIVVSETRVNYY